jgi:hypothetical protein
MDRPRLRPRHWAAVALCAALTAACGPSAAPVSLDTSGTAPAAPGGATPVAWRVEPTPTPGPPTARPGTLPPLPTPTQEPPLQCRFGDRTVSVLPAFAPGPATTPGAAPTSYRGAPGYRTFATGEPLPGVVLELRLPSTTFVAGAVIPAEVRVRNTSSAAVSVVPSVAAVPDGRAASGAPAPADPRSFPSLVRSLGPGGPSVPSGQTWSIPCIVQVPFDAAEPVHLHASVGLATAAPTQPGPGVRVMADLPLHLTAATPAQELHLDLHVDHRQWCLWATEARGGTPAGPLLVRMTARSATTSMEGDLGSAGAAATWAARWDPRSFPTNVPLAASFWVGGPGYVTAVAHQTLAAGP